MKHYIITNAELTVSKGGQWVHDADPFPYLPTDPDPSLHTLLIKVESIVRAKYSLVALHADLPMEERWGFDDINEDTGGLDLELEDGTMLSVYFLVIENPRPLNKKDMR